MSTLLSKICSSLWENGNILLCIFSSDDATGCTGYGLVFNQLFVNYEGVNTSGVVCDELSVMAPAPSPFIFYVVFGLLLAAVMLMLVLCVTGRRRHRRSRRAAAVDAAAGKAGAARFTARIRLVVVTGGRQRLSPNSMQCHRSTPTTTPSARTGVILETPKPDTTAKETS